MQRRSTSLSSADPQELVDKMKHAEIALDNALAWLAENDTGAIRRGVSGSGEAITKQDIENLQKFDQLLRDRFSGHIKAITERSRK